MDKLTFFKKLSQKKLMITLPVSLLLIALASVAVALISLMIQPTGLSNIILCLRESNFLILLLNILPVILPMLFIFFVSNNLVLSVGIPAIFIFLISVVNRTKIYMRLVPLTISDVVLVRELIGVFQNFSKSLIFYTILITILVLLTITAMLIFIRNTKTNIFIKTGGALTSVFVFAALNGSVYNNRTLYENFYVVGSIYSQMDNFNSKGLLYSMIYTQNTVKITKSADYHAENSAEFLSGFKSNNQTAAQKSEIKPDIIVIMGEAFSDISKNKAFDFSNYTDPLANFTEIKNNSVSGHIVVPAFGGGTSETEFDFITGINSRLFRNGYTPYSLLNRDVDSTAWQLRRLGYYAEGLHPGEPWFYGRFNAYKYLGFERFMDMSYFDTSKKAGLFILEEETIRVLIENYDNFKSTNPDTPYYSFLVNIQNHGPYNNKYGAKVNFDTSLDLNETETDQLSNYFRGIMDYDRELLRLTEYLDSLSRPVVLVYFGDHVPIINNEFYDKLLTKTGNEMTDHINRHTIPYIIWQNSAYRSEDDFTAREKSLTENESFSSFYLSAYLFHLIGLDLQNNYFDYIYSLMDAYPVILEQTHLDKRRELHENKSNNDIERLRNIQYYKLFDE